MVLRWDYFKGRANNLRTYLNLLILFSFNRLSRRVERAKKGEKLIFSISDIRKKESVLMMAIEKRENC